MNMNMSIHNAVDFIVDSKQESDGVGFSLMPFDKVEIMYLAIFKLQCGASRVAKIFELLELI